MDESLRRVRQLHSRLAYLEHLRDRAIGVVQDLEGEQAKVTDELRTVKVYVGVSRLLREHRPPSIT